MEPIAFTNIISEGTIFSCRLGMGIYCSRTLYAGLCSLKLGSSLSLLMCSQYLFDIYTYIFNQKSVCFYIYIFIDYITGLFLLITFCYASIILSMCHCTTKACMLLFPTIPFSSPLSLSKLTSSCLDVSLEYKCYRFLSLTHTNSSLFVPALFQRPLFFLWQRGDAVAKHC